MEKFKKLIQTIESLESDLKKGINKEAVAYSAKSALMVAKMSRDEVANADYEEELDVLIERLEDVIRLSV